MATCDIKEEYLHALMDEVIHMKIEGFMIDFLCAACPRYKNYIKNKQSKRILYVQLKKVLYGCKQSGRLFWKHLTGTLQQMGFTVNSYDQCVANKVIDGYQCTIIWHVDDLIISYANPDVVAHFIKDRKSVV